MHPSPIGTSIFLLWVQKEVDLDALPLTMPHPFQTPQENQIQGARAVQVLLCLQTPSLGSLVA